MYTGRNEIRHVYEEEHPTHIHKKPDPTLIQEDLYPHVYRRI